MLDWRQAMCAVRDLADRAGARARAPVLLEALGLLERLAGDPAGWGRRAAEAAPGGRPIALPWEEPPAARFPLPPGPFSSPVIAADGAQIPPDPHGPVLYAVINIGLIALRPGSGEAPRIRRRLWLGSGEELFTEDGELRPAPDLEVERGVRELEALAAAMAEYAADPGGPPVGLADGTLLPRALARDEPWAGGSPARREELFSRVLAALAAAREAGGIVGGYIDRPTSRRVVRLLELGAGRPLPGLSDRELFAALLRPGERSALFEAGWPASERLAPEGHRLLVFYLNVGDEAGRPYIVAVEVPEWAARDRGRLDRLHRALWDQCRILYGAPYPYLLIRAHEEAFIRPEERERLEELMVDELLRRGVVARPSAKGYLKEIGRRR